MREAKCVKHNVPLGGPECGPTCEELSKQAWLAALSRASRIEDERGS